MARHIWVDNAKGIGMMLVVYGHAARGVHASGLPLNGPWYEGVDNVLYGFHMPLFFLLSGLFFHRSLASNGTMRMIGNRLRTIVYPYVVWSLLQRFVEVALARHTNSGARLSEVLAFPWHPRAQFWFLYVMFLYCVVGAVLFSRRTPLRIISAILTSVVLYLHGFQGEPSGLTHQFTTNAIYFVVGVAIGDADRVARVLRRGWALILSAGIFVASEFWLNEFTSLNYRDNGWMGLMIGLSGIAMTCGVALRVAGPASRFLGAVGVHSIAVYVLHILFIAAVRMACVKIFGVTDVALILSVATALGIMVPLALAIQLERMRFGILFAFPQGGTRLGLKG